jgi:hypothetical protein
MERSDFGIEPRPASCYFPGVEFFVDAAFSSRFPLEVFYRICDVNFFAVNSCFRKRFIQELAGGADEWFAFQVFVIARLFADKNNCCVGQALADHSLRSVFP